MRAFEKEKIMYGEDYSRQDNPWMLWEYLSPRNTKYHPLTTDPLWIPTCKYRRKLKTVVVNGVELVAPETEAPAVGVTFWLANNTTTNWAKALLWDGGDVHLMWLGRGLVFLEKDHAADYAKARLGAKGVPTGNLDVLRQVDLMMCENGLTCHAVYAQVRKVLSGSQEAQSDKLIIPKQYQTGNLFGTPWKEVVIFYENGPALAVPRSQCEEG